MTNPEDRLIPCPGVEMFLDSAGDLYLLPIGDRSQLRVEAPWGRWAWTSLRGESVATMPIELADELARILDWLESESFVRRAGDVHSDDTARWDRQVRWFAQETGNGPDRQRRLADATVLVLGVGGLGCRVADHFARAGIGTLVLVDDDVVDVENLARQPLYTTSDLGRRKVDVAAARLRDAMPDLRVERSTRPIASAADVVALLAAHDPMLIVCAADRPPVSIKTWVEDAASAYGVAVMHGGHRPPYSFAGPFYVPGLSPCYECFSRARVTDGAEQLEAELRTYRDLDCPQLPAIGWGDATSAALIAGQGVQWLAGIADPALLGRELELDLRTLETRFLNGPTAPGCARCEHDHSSAMRQ